MSRRRPHGLVIGKFYPPHAGHHLLIETAAARCERLTVIVMASSVETIALADRVAWLRATHPGPQISVVGCVDDVEVDFTSDSVWEAHVTLMRAALERDTILAGRDAAECAVDVVATSEEYGHELARRLGAEHLLVDLTREARPVSGTAVRADVVGHWPSLAPATRAGLALRVVVLGAESTGTTTVSRAVAEALRGRGGVWAETRWVPEYGREFTARKLEAATVLARRAGRALPDMHDLVWTPEDFPAIAARQRRMEDDLAATGSPVLVCDTDAFATDVWHRRYVGAHSPAVRAIADARPGDLYLVTDHEGVPFVQDGLRDGEHLRAWMTGEFLAELTASGRPWQLLTGPLDERVAAALRLVDALVAGAFRFADPLG